VERETVAAQKASPMCFRGKWSSFVEGCPVLNNPKGVLRLSPITENESVNVDVKL
jgi:hypothetical protein